MSLRFAQDDDGPDYLPSLSLVLAASQGETPVACAFVYPQRGQLAMVTAVLGALSRLSSTFPVLAADFIRTGLPIGQRVAVLPTGHIYQFDGVFDDPRNRLSAPFVRLRLLDRRQGAHVREPTVRIFPANEILRLQPTTRTVPIGKQNTELGSYTESALDRILGIGTYGNTSLLRNEVLLLANRSEVESFRGGVRVDRFGSASEYLKKLLSWGTVAEDGTLEADDRFKQEDEPLVAVTHAIDRLAEACESAAFCSKLVIIDGATAVLRNLQAYDRIATCQRVLIVSDHGEEDCFRDLSARDCKIWWMSAKEILAIDTPNVGKSISSGVGYFSSITNAAKNSEQLRVTAIPVEEKAIDEIAAALAEADRVRPADKEDVSARVIGWSFSALLELSGWLTPPSEEGLADFKQRLHAVERELNDHVAFLPVAFTGGLREALAQMNVTASDPLVGSNRLMTLVATLDERRSAGASVAVIVKNATIARSLAPVLADLSGEASVFPANLIPKGADFDSIVLTSWLRRDILARVITQYASEDVRLIACDFEHRWLRSFRQKVQSWLVKWNLDNSAKAALVGIDFDTAQRFWRGDAERKDTPSKPQEVEVPDSATESWLYPRRKGTPAAVAAEHERRPARYVGFVGNTYAYVTPSRALPVVTDLVRGMATGSARVPMKTVDQLRAGEYVLFRDQGERDVVALFAEQVMGPRYKERRAISGEWRVVLERLGPGLNETYRRLHDAGVKKHRATVRSWLLDPDKIGPGSRADLEAIAQAVGDQSFAARIPDVWDAIGEVRGAHISAGQRLSEFLLAELPKKLNAAIQSETFLDLTLVQAWLVEIEQIGEPEDREYTEVNRLLWEEGYSRRLLTPLRARRAIGQEGTSWQQ